jgi:hypothetical protein
LIPVNSHDGLHHIEKQRAASIGSMLINPIPSAPLDIPPAQ